MQSRKMCVSFFCPISATIFHTGYDYSYLYCSFVQILTNAPAVLTTATVHSLHVQTQWDPSVARVTVLTAEMAELAIYHQVIKSPNIRKMSIYRPLVRDGKTSLIFHAVINHQELRDHPFTRLARGTLL